MQQLSQLEPGIARVSPDDGRLERDDQDRRGRTGEQPHQFLAWRPVLIETADTFGIDQLGYRP